MPCKPGVAGSIPGFSIKPILLSLRCSRHIINTQTINLPSPVLVTTHGKAKKNVSFFVVSVSEFRAMRTAYSRISASNITCTVSLDLDILVPDIRFL